MSGHRVEGAGRFDPPRSPVVAVGLLVFLAVPLFFVKLGGAGLVDPDEPYYAVPALEMLKSGTWWIPVLHGQPWLDKPILFYWIVLGAFKTFGVSEWAARLGSALAGLGGAVAVATLSPRGWRRGGAHVLAAVILATSLEYAFLSRSAVTDMTLTLFLTLGFLAVARYLESGGLGAATWGGAAFGLATLTKGPVGVLVPAVALLGYGLSTRRRELLGPKAIAAAACGFAATAVPWYAYMFAAHRELVVNVFLGKENLGRFVNPEHRQLPLFYAIVLAAGLLPWSVALPPALLRAIRDLLHGADRPGTSPGPVFALAWFAAVLGVFSLSASKLLTYILPAFPAAAFLIADYWCHALAPRPAGERAPQGPLLVAWTGAAITIAIAAAILLFRRDGRFADSGSVLYGLAIALTAAAIAAVAAVRAGRLARFVGVQAAAAVAVVLVAVVVVVGSPGFEASSSTRTFVERLVAGGLADQVAGAYQVHALSLDFYLGRTLVHENDADGLAVRVQKDPGRLWIVRSSDVDDIASHLPLRLERVATVSRCTAVRLSPGGSGTERKDGS
jgi:4-amino-4-deoxy-L-arabinose transferase-like glycosyltransferase